MATEAEARQALAELQAALTAKTSSFEETLRKLEAKANRMTFGLPGASASSMYRGETTSTWSSSDEGKAFDAFLRRDERKAMSLSDDTQGGYLAPPQFNNEIMLVSAEQGAIRGLARKYAPGTGDFTIPVSPTLAGAGRTTELSTRSNTTTPGLAAFRPENGGVYAVAPVSNWLLNDASYDVAAFVRESIGIQFGVTESADFVTGDGVNKARGFATGYTLAATADATRAWAQIEKLHAGSTTALDIDDLIDLRAKLAPRYQKNAAFVMNQNTEAYIRKLKASSSGDYYWQPAVAAGEPNTLLGVPCYVDVNMPDIASAAVTVAIADWSKFYAVVDIGQTVVLRDPYTSKGNTLFYVEKRVGGGVLDFNAGKLLVMST